MDLRWTDNDLAWGEGLLDRLGQTVGQERQGLWDEAGIAAAVLPDAERPVADPARAMIAMQALGRVLATELPAETLVMAAHLLSAKHSVVGGRPKDLSPARPIAIAWMAPGTDDPFFTRATATASGWKLSGVAPVVADTDGAEDLLLGARCGRQALVFRLPLRAAGLQCLRLPTIDGGEAAEVVIEGVVVDEQSLVISGEEAERAMQRGIAAATALSCARACGMMRYLVEATVAYLRERKQFGRALAEFQALQHRAVDMLIETELAEAASLRALLSFQSGHRDQELAVAAAKVTASGSARFVGQNTIQLHGGKGMDASTRVTDYFRALTAFELSFGLASQHIARIAALER